MFNLFYFHPSFHTPHPHPSLPAPHSSPLTPANHRLFCFIQHFLPTAPSCPLSSPLHLPLSLSCPLLPLPLSCPLPLPLQTQKATASYDTMLLRLQKLHEAIEHERENLDHYWLGMMLAAVRQLPDFAAIRSRMMGLYPTQPLCACVRA